MRTWEIQQEKSHKNGESNSPYHIIDERDRRVIRVANRRLHMLRRAVARLWAARAAAGSIGQGSSHVVVLGLACVRGAVELFRPSPLLHALPYARLLLVLCLVVAHHAEGRGKGGAGGGRAGAWRSAGSGSYRLLLGPRARGLLEWTDRAPRPRGPRGLPAWLLRLVEDGARLPACLVQQQVNLI
eukprot:SAG31_NODE_4803_length_2947_cov_1.853230_2_plen_185_part_00